MSGFSGSGATAVVLTSRTELGRTLRENLEQADLKVLATPDAYAAAVTLLIVPQAVLLVDTQTLRRDQCKLLSLATRLAIPTLGFGRPRAGRLELDDLPLVDTEEIVSAVCQVLQLPQPAQVSEQSAQVELSPIRPEDTEAVVAQIPQTAEAQEGESSVAALDELAKALTKPITPTSLSDLLTEEESRALLEGQDQ